MNLERWHSCSHSAPSHGPIEHASVVAKSSCNTYVRMQDLVHIEACYFHVLEDKLMVKWYYLNPLHEREYLEKTL